jgi:Ca2+-binding EF-hand superfamily protein
LENLAVYNGVVEHPQTYHPLVERLRSFLAQRGTDGVGFADMQRYFHAMDRDNTKTLHPEEFKGALQKLNLNFSDQEFSQLFAFFDNYGNGYIDYEEFILCLRGHVNWRRRQLIAMAWYYVDFNKEGRVDPEEIIGRYDATQHPDVRGGAKSAQEVFRDFLKAFEVSGEIEGKVTRKEFENYYYNVSASIERDDYFETMMRNCWHLSGQNWPGQRYKVVHADGRESIEEVWNWQEGRGNGEQWNEHSVMARLRSMGMNPVSFSRYEGNYDPFTNFSDSYYGSRGYSSGYYGNYGGGYGGYSFGPSGYYGGYQGQGNYSGPGNYGGGDRVFGSTTSGFGTTGGYSSPRGSPRRSPRGSPRNSPRRFRDDGY